jgi:hypothetical protein
MHFPKSGVESELAVASRGDAAKSEKSGWPRLPPPSEFVHNVASIDISIEAFPKREEGQISWPVRPMRVSV